MKKPYQIEAQRAVKQFEEMAANGNPAVQMLLPMAEMVGWLRKGVGELIRQAGLQLMDLLMQEEVRDWSASAVNYVRFPPRQVLGVARIHQKHFESAFHQNFVTRCTWGSQLGGWACGSFSGTPTRRRSLPGPTA